MEICMGYGAMYAFLGVQYIWHPCWDYGLLRLYMRRDCGCKELHRFLFFYCR